MGFAKERTMPRKALASLLLILIWVATFVPYGNSVYNPTPVDVQELGGEKQPLDPPQDETAPPSDDED